MVRAIVLIRPDRFESIGWVAVTLFLIVSVASPRAVAEEEIPSSAASQATLASEASEASDAADLATRQLIRAAERGRVRSVVDALAAGARLDENRAEFVGPGKQSPLVSASLRGYDRVVRVLLERGADPAVPEKDGFTVWHAAAFQGRTDVLIVLDEFDVPGYGISPKDGFTPLHRAAWGRTLRHVRAVEYLIGPSGRPCDSVATDGQTPLDVAKHERIKTMLEACLEESSAAQTKSSD
jgi:ankyrin repeat protein